MAFIKEFKEFAMRGNLVDLAVAFVMGAAFGKIVTSFVDGLVMPLVSILTGEIDFNDKTLVLKKPVQESILADGTVVPAIGEISVKYGTFITNLVDFIIVAFAVFLVIKAINSMKKATPAPPLPGPSGEEKLLEEIRDLLIKQNKG